MTVLSTEFTDMAGTITAKAGDPRVATAASSKCLAMRASR